MVLAVLCIFSKLQLDATAVYKLVSPSVVSIKTDTGTGSGFVINRSGLVCTAAHVIDGAKTVSVRFSDGSEYESTGIVDVDQKNDLAVIRARFADRPELQLKTGSLDIGSKLFIVSAPLGLDFSISEGIISQYRTLEGIRMIQHTCQTSPGSSGGPMIDQTGQVVGIHNSKRVGGEGLNFAVVSELVKGLDLTMATMKWIDRPKLPRAQDNLSSLPITENDLIKFAKSIQDLYYVRDLSLDVQQEVLTKSPGNIVLSSVVLSAPLKIKSLVKNLQEFKTIAPDALKSDLSATIASAQNMSEGFYELLTTVEDLRQWGYQAGFSETFSASGKKIRTELLTESLRSWMGTNVPSQAKSVALSWELEADKRKLITEFRDAFGAIPYVSRFPQFKVASMFRNKPLHKAGVEEGDVILAIDGKTPLTCLGEAMQHLSQSGSKLTLEIQKPDGRTRRITIRGK
jgi:S1-C subfamily serine protease